MANPQRQTLSLQFPVRGIVKGFALTEQPFVTTPDALNVRPESIGLSVAGQIEARRRGGSRPGTGRYYDKTGTPFQFGGGQPIRLLAALSNSRGQNQQEWQDNFSGEGPSLSNVWSQAPWISPAVDVLSASAVGTVVTVNTDGNHGLTTGESTVTAGFTPTGYNGQFVVTSTPSSTQYTYSVPTALASPTLSGATSRKYARPEIFPADATELVFNEDLVGVMRNALTDADFAKPYIIAIKPIPYDGFFYGEFSIFARALDSGNGTGSLDATHKGIVATLNLANGVSPSSAGNYSGSITEYFNGSVVQTTAFASGTTGTLDEEEFYLIIEETRVRAFWGSVTLADVGVGPGGGYAFGFGGEVTVTSGNRPVNLVDYASVRYYRADDSSEEPPLQLLISAGGLLYRETEETLDVELVPSTATLASDRLLMAAQFEDTVYIADNGLPKVQIDAATIVGNRLSSTEIPDWTIYGIDPATDVVSISNGSDDEVDGVWRIAAVGPTEVELIESIATASRSADIIIERAPKKYNGNTRALEIWNAKDFNPGSPEDGQVGIIPTGCPLTCTFLNAMVLAGPWYAPYTWYMSRQGDPLDWDYAATDVGGAVAGTVSDSFNVGVIGGPITALIPHSDDYLIFATADSMNILRGHPRQGGRIDVLSRVIGCAGKKAWAWGPSGELVVFSYNGLYLLNPGAGQSPMPLSDIALPDDLAIPDVDRKDYEVLLEYDPADRGLHIYIVNLVTGTLGRHFWMDWNSRGFFRVVLPLNSEPSAILSIPRRFGKDSAVILGCRDGYVRGYRDALENDDSTPFSSYVYIGPIGNAAELDTVFDEIQGSMAQESGDVTWEIHGGDTIQRALESTTPLATGTWAADRNYTRRPRVRARWFYLKLKNGENGDAWAFESASAVLARVGQTRLL